MPKPKETKGDLKAGWAPVPKSELEMVPRRQKGSKYAEVLDSFLKSGNDVWKKKELTNAEVTGLQTQKAKVAYKHKLSIRTHQESPTTKGEPYNGTYTVFLVRGKET